MELKEIIVNGVKKKTAISLDDDFFEVNDNQENLEDTLDLTDKLNFLENTLVLNKDDINESN